MENWTANRRRACSSRTTWWKTIGSMIEMKSAQINEYGGSEVIKINQSTSEPTVSPGKVLVFIKASGVNPADWKIREGVFQQMIQLQFYSTVGIDFSGVIKTSWRRRLPFRL
jgi:D-arabinose 1-dehydrogenase-like Zn-dependent alcohol dehydrogenase